MTRRAIILYWLLLLVPATVIGVAAALFLCREQERINQQARTTALGAVSVVADNLKLAVIAAEESISDELKRLDGDNIRVGLQEWERSNPLIRNMFIWNPQSGLQIPSQSNERTIEERLFAARYSALFSGRIPFETAGEEDSNQMRSPPNQTNAKNMASRKNQQVDLQPQQQIAMNEQAAQAQQVSGYNDGNVDNRMVLRDIARQSSKGSSKLVARGKAGIKEEVTIRTGWIPWFSEDQLFLLGWARRGTGTPIYGVEIEMMSLLSHLIAAMPAVVPSGVVYVLSDGTGRPFHQAGANLLKAGSKPEFSVSLAPYLPHWQISAHFVNGGPSEITSRRFIVLGGLLLFVFLASIVIGGTLLLWQAHRNMLDAQQKTSFVSNVSHELKTPLTSIRMYAELISEKRVKDPAKVQNYLNVIVSESQRLTRLVNNVLDFSRLEQGRKKYRTENIDAAQSLRNVLETQSLRLREAGISLETSIPDTPPVIAELDKDALEQAVLNLIDNAIKYADTGKELSVALETSLPAHAFRIKVMDRGPGIPFTQRERIFEKFHRIDDSLTASKPGSGLGLTIARRLIRDMGGDLRFEPRDGGGSCFTMEFGFHGERQ